MPPPRQFFPGIHALRIVAATFVVVEHAAFISDSYSKLLMIPYLSYGRVGVILFFAISGFVIALQRHKPVRIFVFHRLLRIYPSYWLAMLLAAVAMAAVHKPLVVGLSSLLLYPSTDTAASTLWIPYWTLTFEAAFYALAAAAFALRLSDRTLTVMALLWIVAVNLLGHDIRSPAEYGYPGLRIPLAILVQVFPMGLICGIHFEKFKRAGRTPYLFAAATAFFCSTFFAEMTLLKVLTLGICSSCVILATADLDIRARSVKFLGDASYGIYLLHLPTMVFMVAIAPSLGLFEAFAVGMVSGTAFGLLDHAMYRRMISAMEPRKSPM